MKNNNNNIKINENLSGNQIFKLTNKFDDKFWKANNEFSLENISNEDLILIRIRYSLLEHSSEHIGKDYGLEEHQLCYEEMERRSKYLKQDIKGIYNKMLKRIFVSVEYQLHLLWIKENFLKRWKKFSTYDGENI